MRKTMNKLPKIDKIPNLKEFQNYFKPALLDISKSVLEEIRSKNQNETISEQDVINLIKNSYALFQNIEPKPLINATGVIIHTNLGRSPIGENLIKQAAHLVTSYSNLEYSLSNGKRGDRYAYTSYLCKLLFGCEDALIVNNNAAAVFLVLNSFAGGKEVPVSRGELVEIGGSFRVPEVMKNSGAILKEIGTTNKTHLSDYENSINENTAMILKVHKSNYDIVGFSSEVSINDIAKLTQKSGILSYYDLGSGYVNTLPYSLSKNEPNVKKLIQSGVDIISFSGDKLFGSVQCGIILGKKELINKLKNNQILRMLRVDKMVLSVLNETIKAYLNKDFHLIKPINQIYKTLSELEMQARRVLENIKLEASIKETKTFVGGGTMPNKSYPSIGLFFKGNANKNELKFRKCGIIGRIENEEFLLDFRSIFENEIENIIKIINGMSDE
ncbi:L-seryl-tRNA(Sec) selenium transferase [Campylobacter fetus]|uniref:L-seryl-tRNA(Sec) selenium transferase n=1 Tax=Campylobacter fetus TaxID=196 RepID=UPI00041841D1|nr:L-seryl-tRNA(Sec) selenium transferase [Campylobacter fetus]AVK81761.1 L-seryl-tRNA(Sec) selenium transferase [Campylobacter fetus subsp. testudinum]EAI4322012.1 L-seryl-tRNA(Sec) selenium transferase [Campylobacter fetus]EAI4391646.1 L-seryl-tRNA(Sec) selenium transferase [Campylobacter fetus]EAK0827164.1 L-seryl-tRNA(Sec) selenium transferase [Campylobacter fetus]MPB71909.1 L-seryl-tRNA(Sec) selenium transferase [Campylobacter fetus]